MSNFTLIGKKNGMMDIIRGNMDGKKKERRKKRYDLHEPKGKGTTVIFLFFLNSQTVFILTTSRQIKKPILP